MLLEIHRLKAEPKATLGVLSVDGVFECLTLEDVVRDLGPNGEGKVFGETAIPAGTYKVVVNMSQRFGKLMPRLVDVPFFTGILIHKGNRSADTHGCILVGQHPIGNDFIAQSTPAFDSLFRKIKQCLDHGGDVSISIYDTFRRSTP